jgi:hypothetical protein
MAVNYLLRAHQEGSNSYQQSTRPQLHVGEAQRLNGQRDVGKTELRFEPEDVMLEFRADGKFIVEM